MATRRVFVAGVGMTKFEKPGRREDFDYPQMAKEAGTHALNDAGISFDQIQQACVGYVYGDSTCGQRAVYELGRTGIPVYNVNNNCSTGSTALFMAAQLVRGGLAECVLALGFEKMERGSLGAKFMDRTNPLDKHVEVMADTRGFSEAPMAPQMFGNAAREHEERFGSDAADVCVKIAAKNHRHSVHNPYSQFNKEYTEEEIRQSPMVHAPLTKLACCPTSDGAAAAVVCSEQFIRDHNLQSQAVEICAIEMSTDFDSSFDGSAMRMVGFEMSKSAAQKAYAKANVTPKDVQVVELHDCFAANELITYEALGLCDEGKAGEMVLAGDNTFGGKVVVNPSGGLISKGHPLGATGLAQCAELSWQLRGQCGARQVPHVTTALQHNIGLGGAAVVAIYKLGFPEAAASRPRLPDSHNPALTVQPLPVKSNL